MQFLLKFFKDKKGHIVIWQTPNFLLWSWIALKLISFIIKNGKFGEGIKQLATAVLFTWAIYETAKGVSNFRKTLGLAVLTIIVIGFFS